jgi:ferritin-like metal-binding protein YciE
MAAYGTVVAFSQELGEDDHASLLTESLKEEKETDEKLSQLAKQINTQANQGGDRTEVGDERTNKKKTKRAA